MRKVNDLLTKSVDQILPSKEGLQKLISSKKTIKVYLGIDPTGSKLHLGHSIGLKKLKEFADADHEAILLFGTGTVLAGDPSQRSAKRHKITKAEIEKNVQTWKTQASRIVDFDGITIKENGDWLNKLSYAEIIDIASNISATQLLKREMFQERIKRGDTVMTHEMLYPLLQGYDSYHMDVDLEIGGTDQLFNMLIGRELQKKMGRKEKFVLTTPLILGTDGQPMSKTSDNCIWLDDSPMAMFGKIMSMSDNQIEGYRQLLTSLPKEDFKSLKHMDAKKKLGQTIVSEYYGKDKGHSTLGEFEEVIQHKSTPTKISYYTPTSGATIPQIVMGSNMAGSISEAKRLIGQGAISGTVSPGAVPYNKYTDPTYVPTQDFVLKKGNREFRNIKIEK